jgi:hypothetical protein
LRSRDSALAPDLNFANARMVVSPMAAPGRLGGGALEDVSGADSATAIVGVGCRAVCIGGD